MTTMPTSNIDAYSEYYQYVFEPREVQKGNTARAIAYFFTMYPTEAGAITRVLQPSLLCTWNDNDPVDAQETTRNNRIFQYQRDKNPYVLHEDWVRRAWCPAVATAHETVIAGIKTYPLYPNPASTTVTLRVESQENMAATVRIVDAFGRLLEIKPLSIETGRNSFELATSDYATGLYYLQLVAKNGIKTLSFAVMR